MKPATPKKLILSQETLKSLTPQEISGKITRDFSAGNCTVGSVPPCHMTMKDC